MSDRCIHELERTACTACTPSPAATRRPPATTYIAILSGSGIYHYADCIDVNWDPAEAHHPGERLELTVAQVRELLASGTLKRGCLRCGANATTEPHLA